MAKTQLDGVFVKERTWKCPAGYSWLLPRYPAPAEQEGASTFWSRESVFNTRWRHIDVVTALSTYLAWPYDEKGVVLYAPVS